MTTDREMIKILTKELKKYRAAYALLICYFDSISDDEQKVVSQKLSNIFKTK